MPCPCLRIPFSLRCLGLFPQSFIDIPNTHMPMSVTLNRCEGGVQDFFSTISSTVLSSYRYRTQRRASPYSATDVIGEQGKAQTLESSKWDQRQKNYILFIQACQGIFVNVLDHFRRNPGRCKRRRAGLLKKEVSSPPQPWDASVIIKSISSGRYRKLTTQINRFRFF